MNRDALEQELKNVGVTLKGWLPVLQCDVCKHHWEPFSTAVGSNSSSPTVRFDYWQCKNGCNSSATASRELQTAMPKYVVINDIPGMLFDESDLEDFERYVRSMDATEVPNRGL